MYQKSLTFWVTKDQNITDTELLRIGPKKKKKKEQGLDIGADSQTKKNPI